MLHADLVIRTAHLSPLGILVFMIAQSFIVSTRIANTFRRERRLHDMDDAKSRFLATISHELRTPISLIVSPVEQVMRGRYGDSVPAQGEIFAALKRNGYRLLNIVEGMFDFARIELGKLRPRLEAVEPGRVVAFYASELESIAQKMGVSLDYANGLDGPCSVLLDLRLFEIAFFNIASNALKFTPPGGSIRIEARL
jgi:signal transduction histidine kinase